MKKGIVMCRCHAVKVEESRCMRKKSGNVIMCLAVEDEESQCMKEMIGKSQHHAVEVT